MRAIVASGAHPPRIADFTRPYLSACDRVCPRRRDDRGGDEGTRTPDPRDANAVLFQLSYIPTGPGV